MEELIEIIFTENGFVESGRKDSVIFYKKQDEQKKEYYLVDFINPEDLSDFMNKEKANNIFELFEEQKKQGVDIEKNTSLLLCVRLNNIKNDISAIKNDVLFIEEDDFWFKKYVITYSDGSVPDAPVTGTYLEYFNQFLLDNDTFREYKNDVYLNEKYFLVIQLFLKLPFLNVPINTENNFNTIEDILSQQLSTIEMQFAVNVISIEGLEDAEYWERLKSNCMANTDTDDLIKEFFDKFEHDA